MQKSKKFDAQKRGDFNTKKGSFDWGRCQTLTLGLFQAPKVALKQAVPPQSVQRAAPKRGCAALKCQKSSS